MTSTPSVFQLSFIPLAPGTNAEMQLMSTILPNGATVELYLLGGNVSIYQLNVTPAVSQTYTTVGTGILYTTKGKKCCQKIVPLQMFPAFDGDTIYYTSCFTMKCCNIQNAAYMNISFVV